MKKEFIQVGQILGKLTVLAIDGGYSHCKCACGKLKTVKTFYLKHGRSRSCGCARHQSRVSVVDKKVSVMLANYKDKAKRRGLDFTLSKKEFKVLVTTECHYCKTIPNPTAGVDRKDSNKGYVCGNVLPACGVCNFAKSDTPYEDFVNWIERVHANLVQQ